MTKPSTRGCRICGGPRPRGRTVYCGDVCTSKGYAENERAKAQKRMSPCIRCGAAKPVGVRGGRLCLDCRENDADVTRLMDRERNRRRDRTVAPAARIHLPRPTSEAPAGHKWCARCQRHRTLASFTHHRTKIASYCRPCQRAYNQERRLRLIYGLTWDQYQALYDAQAGRCAICQRQPRTTALAVDHDHGTGRIRGLLCGTCNHKLLGAARENVDVLQRAVAYLTDPPAFTVLPGAIIPAKTA